MNGTIRRCNGSITFLSSCVPNLGFNCLSIHLNEGTKEIKCQLSLYRKNNEINLYAPSSKLHSYSGLGFQVKFISSKSWEQVTFTDSRISNQHDCKIRWEKVKLQEMRDYPTREQLINTPCFLWRWRDFIKLELTLLSTPFCGLQTHSTLYFQVNKLNYL